MGDVRLVARWIVLLVAPATIAFGLPAAPVIATATPARPHERPVQAAPPPHRKQATPPRAVMLATAIQTSPRTREVVADAAAPTSHDAKLSPQDAVIYPGKVSTFAGNGVNATRDGTGTSFLTGAEFKDMGGAVVVGTTVAYVATVGAIRKVDLTTASVTTLAGSDTQTDCINGAATVARFGTLGDMTSDGTYLYVSDPGCGIRKVSLGTGDTSTLATLIIGSVSIGTAGFLYVAGNGFVYKVNTSDGTYTNFYQFDAYHHGISIASDSTYLWVSTSYIPAQTCGTHLLRILISDPTMVTQYALPGLCTLITGTGQLLLTGNYLYVSNATDTGVERITTADPVNTVVQVSGTSSAGYADGTGTDAWFSKVTGLAADGTNLWVDDSTNHRFRKVVADNALPKAQSSTATTNVSIYPGKVTTIAGDGINATTNGTGTAAEFRDMAGAVVVGGATPAAYVATVGAIRKVILASAVVSTFAGSPTVTGCTNSTDPLQATFGALGDLTTDGYYLYVLDHDCSTIRRISLATGATSTLTSSIVGSVSFGPDGFLYVAGAAHVYRVDVVNGTYTNFYDFDIYHQGISIASDSTYLWVSTDWLPSGVCGTQLLRITISSGEVKTYSIPGYGCPFITGHGQLVSAGNYLYVSSGGDTGVERITKTTGAIGTLVGGISGWVDDSWNRARFSKVTGLASDGTNLWVDDSDNHRFREVQFVPLLAQEIGPGSSPDATAPRAMSGDPVDTSSGNFTWSVTDAAVPGIGMPFVYSRSYSTLLPRQGARLGYGWTDCFDAFLEPDDAGGDVAVSMPDGQTLSFTKNGSNYTASQGIWDTLSKLSSTYLLVQPDGTTYTFDLYGVLQSITDRNNHALALHYTGAQLTSVTDTVGRTMTFSYPDASTMTLTLQGGRAVTYHIGNGLLTSVDDLGTSSPGTTTYSYTGQVLQEILDQNNEMVVFNTYQPVTGEVDTQEDTNGTSSYLFDGLTTYVTDNRGKVWTYQYILPGELGSVTDPYGTSTSYSQYDLHFNPVLVTRPGNRIWQYSYTYDMNNRLVTQLTIVPPITADNMIYTYNSYGEVTSYQDGLNHITRYEYGNTNGNLTCVLLPTATVTTCAAAAQQYKYTYVYYSTKLVKSITDPNNHTTTFSYDSDGDLCWALVGTSTNACSSPPQGSTSYGYDLNTGWRTNMVTPRGNTTPNIPANFTWSYTFWPDNLIHTTNDPLSHTTSYSYYPTGALHSVLDANTHQTTYDYFGGGQLKDVLDPLNHEVSYTYDPNGNLQTVADQNINVTTYAYWDDNQLHTVTDQLNHQWQYSLYDPSVGQITETLPSGGTVASSYDVLDELASITYSNAPTTPNVSFTYDTAGNRHTMTSGSPAFTTTYGYDQLNRLTSVQRSDTGTSFSYMYDAAGNLSRRTYPDSTQTSYGYDDHNRMCYAFVGASTAACASPPANSTIYAYSLSNGTIAKTLPNAFVSTATYDTADRLTSLINQKTAPPLSSFTYTLDNVGNPTVVASVVNGTSETIHYTYNNDDRLNQVCYDPAGTCSGSGLAGIAYTYDSVGNITSKVTKGSTSTTTTYRYNSINELCWSYVGTPPPTNLCASPPANSTLFGYDPNGNQNLAGSRVSTYDLAGRLSTSTAGGITDNYTYDGAGNRLKDSATGQTADTYAWDINAGVPLLATETVGSSSRRFIYGADGLISLKTTSSFYYLTDGTGSVTNLTDSNGASKWDYTYEPYGACRTCASHGSNPPTNPMHFDGQYQDSSTSSYDLRARMYDPGTGSFLQADPAGSSPGYTFASGRPTVLSDPTGRVPWGWLLVGLAVTAIVVGAALCIAATEGFCAGVTLAGLGSGAGGTALACQEGGCNEAEQLISEVDEALTAFSESGGGQLALPSASELNQWGGSTLSRLTQGEELMYRVWGGDSEQAGEWLTQVEPLSSAAARAGLALPPGNAATFVSEVLVPAGTRIQVGLAGEAFGQSGGWLQARLLERIPFESFGKGVPLP
jgi:RHS repeat-associated protein